MTTLLSHSRTALAAAVAATALPCSLSAGFYGITFFDNQLVAIDPATGAGSQPLGLGAPVSPYGLAFSGGDLYTFDSGSDRIRKIDTSTGALTQSIDIGVGDLLGEGDLTFAGGGVGFLASALSPDFSPVNDLFSFDLNTGSSTRIGSTDVALDGLAYWGGTLYALGQEQDAMLYTVDLSTAALKAVGSLGIQSNSPFAGLTFGPGGQLYGAVNDRLYSISTSTGLATELDPQVLDIGFSSVSGIAYKPQSVPEAASWAVSGSLLVLLGGHALRRRLNPAVAG